MLPTDVQDKCLSTLKTLGAAVILLSWMTGLPWMTGCSGVRPYKVSNLPVELRASVVENVQTLDLTRLAGPPVDSEIIDRGDLLEVTIAAGLSADDTSTFPVRVDDHGMTMFPELGQLQLAGLHLMFAEQQIAAACRQRGLINQPQVTVTMKQQRENRITVVGGVEEPGMHMLPRSASYLLAAITAAGGLAEDAGTRITIQRPASAEGNVRLAGYMDSATPAANNQPTLVTLSLAEAITRPGGGEYLPGGTTVRIEQRHPAPVEVIGLVRKPGQVDFPMNHDLRVFGAIALGGGVSSQLADEVLVMRYHPETGELTTIKLSLQAAKRNTEENLLLAPGDIVSVEQTPATVVADIMSNVIRFGIGMSTNIPMF